MLNFFTLPICRSQRRLTGLRRVDGNLNLIGGTKNRRGSLCHIRVTMANGVMQVNVLVQMVWCKPCNRRYMDGMDQVVWTICLFILTAWMIPDVWFSVLETRCKGFRKPGAQ